MEPYRPRITVVLCDDIRTEANGKHLLIGVYPTDIVPASFPTSLALAVWLRLSPAPSEGIHRIVCRFDIDDVTVGEAGGNVEIDGVPPSYPVDIALPLPHIPINVERACKLKVYVLIDENDPECAVSMPINGQLL